MSVATAPKATTRKANSSQWLETWRQFAKHKGAVVGMVIFLVIVLTVIFGPLVYPIDPQYSNLLERNQGRPSNTFSAPTTWAATCSPPTLRAGASRSRSGWRRCSSASCWARPSGY